jgi:hypothetical protein
MFDKSEEFIGNNLISGELTETMYLSLQENEQSKGKPNMVWTTDVKHGVVFGFFSAVALAKMFKKKNKNPEYQFSLSTASDIEFITYVQTGVKLKG